jgi:hypothetical protein
MGKPM